MSDSKFNQEHFSEMSSEKDGENGRGEDYTFIKETIRPKKKTRVKKLIFTIAMGITFGCVSCFTFCAFYPFFSSLLDINNDEEDENPITLITATPTPTMVVTSTPTATAEPVSTKLPSKEPDKVGNTPEPNDNFLSYINNVQNTVKSSIVTVNGVKTGVDILDNPDEENKYASGIIVNKDSSNILIMTNTDVIEEASFIKVKFSDESYYNGSIYGVNQQLGIALVRVPCKQIKQIILDSLTVVEMGDSLLVKGGEPVVIMGNPNGYLGSIDYGLISNEQHDAYITDGQVQLINTTIPHNNNGYGFLLGKDGKMLGVMTQKENFTSGLNANLSTCLSISSIRPFIQRMMDGQNNLYLGLVCCDISKEVATRIGVDNKGVYITKVEEKSPAFVGGVKRGDILLSIDNFSIDSMKEYYNKLYDLSVGTKVTLQIKRKQDGKWVNLEMEAVIAKSN